MNVSEAIEKPILGFVLFFLLLLADFSVFIANGMFCCIFVFEQLKKESEKITRIVAAAILKSFANFISLFLCEWHFLNWP